MCHFHNDVIGRGAYIEETWWKPPGWSRRQNTTPRPQRARARRYAANHDNNIIMWPPRVLATARRRRLSTGKTQYKCENLVRTRGDGWRAEAATQWRSRGCFCHMADTRTARWWVGSRVLQQGGNKKSALLLKRWDAPRVTRRRRGNSVRGQQVGASKHATTTFTHTHYTHARTHARTPAFPPLVNFQAPSFTVIVYAHNTTTIITYVLLLY